MDQAINGGVAFRGGWNTNRNFYDEEMDHYTGAVKKQHTIYNYESNPWRYGPELPGRWHHGGVRATENHLWRYLGTIDEEAGSGADAHTDRIFAWNGEEWSEQTAAPIKKMNFGTIASEIGPSH